jgi:hypothetical protein
MARDCGGGPGDGERCIPGCYARGEQCQEVEQNYFCSFAPAFLAQALTYQESLGVWPTMPEYGAHGNANNEVVLDTRSITTRLPDAVLAFFYRADSPPGAEAGEGDVRRHRDSFLRAYGLPPHAAPLVRLDLRREAGVFTLVG